MRIGLTRTENPERHTLYEEWLKGEGIEVVTLSSGESTPEDVKKLDGLVLSGGVDIYPKLYGGSLEYEKSPSKGWKRDRDIFEIKAFETAVAESIPILGICRGLQLINVALEGTLLQDLGVNLNTIHEGNPDKSHGITIEPDTMLHEIIGKDDAKTNSAHHQAIEELGEGLMINCRADDGTVEGIEWANKDKHPFLLGIQWHPERMSKFDLQDSPASKGIRDRFIEAINSTKSNQ